jgi:hypothetical protein
MAHPSLLDPTRFVPSEWRQPDALDPEPEYDIVKVDGGYKIVDGDRVFRVTKPNGRIVCDCRDFAENGARGCRHIRDLVERWRGGELDDRPGEAALPRVPKSPTALRLEHPFRADQIKLKDDRPYVEGAAVLQRLNDVLGTQNWSFVLVGEPQVGSAEVTVRGRLTAEIHGRRVVREDIGAHERRRGAVSTGDTVKAAVTDAIKRCAHQLGVGLHLYSPDGSYRSFEAAEPVEPARPDETDEGEGD